MEILHDNSWVKSNRHLKISAMLAALLLVVPAYGENDKTTNDTRECIEQVFSTDIASNILQKTWLNLPDWYGEVFKNIVNQSVLLENNDILRITEDFINKRLKKNPWISEENRCLFVVNLCVEYLTGEDIYDWEDGDENRTQEFIKAAPRLRDGLDEYTTIITPIIYAHIFGELDKLNSQNMSQLQTDKARELLTKLTPICKLFGIDPRRKLYRSPELYGL